MRLYWTSIIADWIGHVPTRTDELQATLMSHRPQIHHAHLGGGFPNKSTLSDGFEVQIRVSKVADRENKVFRWREQDMNALRRRQRRRGLEAPDFLPRRKQVQTWQMIPPPTIVLAKKGKKPKDRQSIDNLWVTGHAARLEAQP
jgi:hypothetical protein